MNSVLLGVACLLTTAALVRAATTNAPPATTTPEVTTPRRPTTVDPCYHQPTADTVGFTRLLLDIEQTGAIKGLDPELRVFPYEIMVASQTGKLTEMLDTVGYINLLKVLDQLSEQYQHEFVGHLVQHLDEEACRRHLQEQQSS